MLIRTVGFSLEITGVGANRASFLRHLTSIQGSSHSVPKTGQTRVILIDDKKVPNFTIGTVLTIKDQKTYCEWVENNGKRKIAARNLDENNKLIEFNCFVIQNSNGMGLYQHYHQSCSLGSFSKLLRKIHGDWRANEIEEERTQQAAILDRDLTTTEARKIRQNHDHKFTLLQLIKPETLKDVLKEMSEIKSFDYEYVTIRGAVNEAAPVDPFVYKQRKKLSFIKNTAEDGLISGIQNMIKSLGTTKGKIIAIDDEGTQRPFRLYDIPDTFDEIDYDKVVGSLNDLAEDNFAESSVLANLLEVFYKNKAILDAQ
jgi:hypothetical protein